MVNNKSVKIVVIGCGYWGPNLMRNFHELKDAQLVGAADIRKDRLRVIKARYPFLKTTLDYKEFLSDQEIDAVAVATPVLTHHKIVKTTLLAGKHTLVEKPLAQTSRQCKELISLAKKKKLLLMVGHTHEYSPAVEKVKELVRNNELGKIFYLESTRHGLELFPKGANVVWDLAPHDISIILAILGKMPKSAIAVAESHLNRSVENTAYIILKFPQNILGKINVNWLTPVKIRRIMVGGEKKIILFDDVEPVEKVKIYQAGTFPAREHLFPKHQVYRTGDVYAPLLKATEPLYNQCAHFIQCIRQNKTPLTDGESGLRVVKVLEAISKSIKMGGREIKI